MIVDAPCGALHFQNVGQLNLGSHIERLVFPPVRPARLTKPKQQRCTLRTYHVLMVCEKHPSIHHPQPSQHTTHTKQNLNGSREEERTHAQNCNNICRRATNTETPQIFFSFFFNPRPGHPLYRKYAVETAGCNFGKRCETTGATMTGQPAVH